MSTSVVSPTESADGFAVRLRRFTLALGDPQSPASESNVDVRSAAGLFALHREIARRADRVQRIRIDPYFASIQGDVYSRAAPGRLDQLAGDPRAGRTAS